MPLWSHNNKAILSFSTKLFFPELLTPSKDSPPPTPDVAAFERRKQIPFSMSQKVPCRQTEMTPGWKSPDADQEVGRQASGPALGVLAGGQPQASRNARPCLAASPLRGVED